MVLPSKEDYGPSDAQKVILSKQCGRWRMLRELVHLKIMKYDAMFESLPLTQWELRNRGFGEFSKKKEARTQTGDDVQIQEVQTDEVGRR